MSDPRLLAVTGYCLALCACGAAATTSVHTDTTPGGAIPPATPVTAAPGDPLSSPTPAATLTPPATPRAGTSPVHAAIAGCRLVDIAHASSILGGPLTKDSTLSGSVAAFTLGDGVAYVQDDCGFTAGNGAGATLRVVVIEPSPPGHATSADGQQALQSVEADLAAHNARLSPVAGLGDAAVAWSPPDAGFAQVYVLDHDVVLGVAVENSAGALNKAEELARTAVARADSGAAGGMPGS
jgi:hypothetical protein